MNMLNAKVKNSVDGICAMAPMMADIGNPFVVTVAAFDTAREMVNRGEVEGAIYLLKTFPDLFSGSVATKAREIEESDDQVAAVLDEIFSVLMS